MITLFLLSDAKDHVNFYHALDKEIEVPKALFLCEIHLKQLPQISILSNIIFRFVSVIHINLDTPFRIVTHALVISFWKITLFSETEISYNLEIETCWDHIEILLGISCNFAFTGSYLQSKKSSWKPGSPN